MRLYEMENKANKSDLVIGPVDMSGTGWATFVLLISVLFLGCDRGNVALTGEGCPQSDPLLLFLKAKEKVGRMRSVASRRKAVSELAAHPSGQPWVILILTDEEALQDEDARVEEDPPEVVVRLTREFNGAVVAALLEGLPPNPSPAVLWAVTARLDDTSTGRWCETHEPYHVMLATDPIRELACKVLRESLGVDHEFDKRAWRKAIIDKYGPRLLPEEKSLEEELESLHMREQRDAEPPNFE